MRTLNYILGLLCCFPLLLWSCETVVEADLPEHEPQLVVNAVLNPDSLFTVDVSASQSAFSSGAYQQIEDATVQVYQAGQLLFELQHTGNGIYKGDRKPQALQQYELSVSAPGYPDASARTHIPAAPVLSHILAAKAAPRSDFEQQTVTLSFTLDDMPGQENFYYVQAYTPDTSYYEGKLDNRYIRLEFVSPIGYEFGMENRYFFSDKLFDGKQINLTFNVDNMPDKATYVQVAHITKEYYQYVRTLDKQGAGDDFGKIPAPVANNIQNGMGLFAGFNAVTLAVKP
ncbi:DUF4249 domain-containing protein [Pontibacter chitinilyticus]|uniref:DUF4249 domain-containing protein n=1 Tax=Pontibacter chitinilyticus TaxID=2674989 RepID=UPI003219D73D